MATLKNNMRPIHPGEILREEYLGPMELSANKFAEAIGVPANRISEILNESRSITADTALRFARALNTTPEFWMNLQQAYELRKAEKVSASQLKAIKPLLKTGS